MTSGNYSVLLIVHVNIFHNCEALQYKFLSLNEYYYDLTSNCFIVT
jgi:hypothetical protein